MGTLLALIFFGLIVVVFVSLYFVYQKARQPFWSIIVPIYNYLVFCRIAKISARTFWISMIVLMISSVLLTMTGAALPEGRALFMIIGMIYQIVIILALVYVHYRIAKGFGFEGLMGWLMGVAMVFLPFLIFPYLGFSKNVTYHPERLKWL